MANNIDITPGSGKTVATSEQSIGGNTVHVERMAAEGGTTTANGQVAPTNSPATLLAARETRVIVTFTNRGTVDVYIGIATVSTSNGFLLSPGESVDYVGKALVQAVTPAGTGAIHYLEVYNS